MIATLARLGGRAALAVLFACASLTYADTLGYFYSYTNSNFGSATTNDALASQNLSVAPTVSLVSLQTATPTASFGSSSAASVFAQSLATDVISPQASGYSAMVQSYGYSMPATAQTTSASTMVVMNYAAPTLIPSASTVSASASNSAAAGNIDLSSLLLPSSGVTNSSATTTTTVASSIGTTTAYTNGGITTLSTMSTSPYAGISFITARYDTLVTSTLTTSTNLASPVSTISNAALLGAPGNPEPATFGVAGAALALLAFKLRRK